MRITIVGAGPVGLLLSCLLSANHTVTVIDKRNESTRSHSLNINVETVTVIVDYIRNNMVISSDLEEMLHIWSDNPVSTVEIEEKLTEIAIGLGVIIRRGINITSLDTIDDFVIIGADGAKSKIRSLVFNDDLVDIHNVQYMAQLKYHTPGATRPRLAVSAASYSFLNGLSGSDMVIDFESLAPPNDNFRKHGTLHIPIPESAYNMLTKNGKGTYANPWTIEELQSIRSDEDLYLIAKLIRIIKRYDFSLRWRGGWLEDPKITVIPLTIYRSTDVVRLLDNNKLVMLVGDSASGLVFQRGLNKGWLEAVQCARTLNTNDPNALSLALAEYSQYCKTVYESERDAVLEKHRKIISSNKVTSVTGVILTSGLGLLFGSVMSKSLK